MSNFDAAMLAQTCWNLWLGQDAPSQQMVIDAMTALAKEAYAAGAAAHVEHSRCDRCYVAGKQGASYVA